MTDIATRCGFVALIGPPNAGKSTLLNALVGSKVSIVSRKVQTTRALLRGIAIAGEAQLVFIDTPGVFAPKRRLDRAMVSQAWTGAQDADFVCALIDAKLLAAYVDSGSAQAFSNSLRRGGSAMAMLISGTPRK